MIHVFTHIYIPQNPTNKPYNTSLFDSFSWHSKMTRLSLVLFICLLALIIQEPFSEARKHLSMEKKEFPSTKENVVLSALPEKAIPTHSATDDKGHVMVNDERLSALHLTKIDRILQSVPSPAAGH